MDTQLERITAMEHVLNASAQAVEELSAALERYRAILPELSSLKEYYQSPLWLQDHDDDAAGRFPKELRRGVLSEDAVYDLLEQNAQLYTELAQLVEKPRP